MPPSPPPSPPAASQPDFGDPVLAAMVDAIRANRPGQTFRLTPDRLEGDWRLDGSVDDGLGPGRVFIVVSEVPGTLLASPCADPDFRQGGACVERPLATGGRLVLRDTVEANGTVTVLVVLVRPDRSGITAEASNIVLPAGLGPGAPLPSPVRATSPYTVGELAELVVSIEERLRALGGG